MQRPNLLQIAMRINKLMIAGLLAAFILNGCRKEQDIVMTVNGPLAS